MKFMNISNFKNFMVSTHAYRKQYLLRSLAYSWRADDKNTKYHNPICENKPPRFR